MAFLATQTRLLNTAAIGLFCFISAIVCQSPCANVALVASVMPNSISSPTYTSSNISSLDCQWYIRAAVSSSVVVVDTQMYIRKIGSNCSSDYVVFYDGPTTDSPQIQKLCDRLYYFPQKLNSTNEVMTVVFHSDGYNNNDFRFKYYSKEKPVPCRSINLLATTNSSEISSPWYSLGGRYRYCLWMINTDSNSSVVSVDFSDVMLQNFGSCNDKEEYVAIYDGPTTDSERIELLCGSVSQTQRVISTSSHMTILSYSKWAYSGNFKFTYRSIKQNQNTTVSCTNTNLVASEFAQYFASPNYPKKYPSSVDCQWHITASLASSVVVIEVQQCTLEGYSWSFCSSDYVKFYDGPTSDSPQIKTMCGSCYTTQLISSTDRVITVVFHSDQYNNFDGFSFKYFIKEKPVFCPNTNLVASASAAYLTSPNYPNKYPSLVDCQWNITASSASSVVVIEIQQCTLEGDSWSGCSSDYVGFYDGPTSDSTQIKTMCGGCFSNQLISSSNRVMTVVFHSDERNNFDGFNFKYYTKEKQDSCSNVNLVAYEDGSYISSPNYPSYYPSLVDCQWHITATIYTNVVALQVIDIKIGEAGVFNKDYVYIYDGPNTNYPKIGSLSSLSQFNQNRFYSTGSQMTIVFHTDLGTNYRGFSFKYQSQTKLGQNGAPTVYASPWAQETAAYFTSPNYPDNYPSLVNYQWQIYANDDRVVVLELIDLNLEGSQPTCEHDYVEIYDGQIETSERIELLCGRVSSQEFTSSSSYMTVVFRSDEKNNYSGFRFKYSSKKGTEKSEKNKKTAIIVGSVITGIVVIIIIILVCVIFVRKRRNMKLRRGTCNEVSNQLAARAAALRQSAVFIVGQMTFDPSIPPPTYMEGLSHHSTTDPPPYSSIYAHMNDNLPGFSSRNSDYSELDLPPSYSNAMANWTSQQKPAAQPNHSRPERSLDGDQNATRMSTSSATGTDLSMQSGSVMFRPSSSSAAGHASHSGSNTNPTAPPVYASVPHNQHECGQQSQQSHSSTYNL